MTNFIMLFSLWKILNFFFFIYFVEECITVFDGYYCLKKQTNKQDIDGQYSLSSFTG